METLVSVLLTVGLPAGVAVGLIWARLSIQLLGGSRVVGLLYAAGAWILSLHLLQGALVLLNDTLYWARAVVTSLNADTPTDWSIRAGGLVWASSGYFLPLACYAFLDHIADVRGPRIGLSTNQWRVCAFFSGLAAWSLVGALYFVLDMLTVFDNAPPTAIMMLCEVAVLEAAAIRRMRLTWRTAL